MFIYYPDGVANLLSMSSLVKEEYRIQMDLDVGNAINVFNKDGLYVKFMCAEGGLYLLDIDDGYTTVSEQQGNFSALVI